LAKKEATKKCIKDAFVEFMKNPNPTAPIHVVMNSYSDNDER